MNRKLLTVIIASALALGSGAALAGDHDGQHKMMRKHMHGGMKIERLTRQLDLTPEQEAQIKPILEQMKPQLKAIHEEARQKADKVVQDNMAKIRPVLNAEQQTKLDKLQEAREKMREARQLMRDARAD